MEAQQLEEGSASINEPRNRNELRTPSSVYMLNEKSQTSLKMEENGGVEVRSVKAKNHVPLGLRCCKSCTTNLTEKAERPYKISVLVLTFLAYTSYHLAKRPISAVKGTWNPNCTVTAINNTCDAWDPFTNKEESRELFGGLDSAFLFSYAIAMLFSGYIAEHTSLRLYLGFGMINTGIFTTLFGMAYFWNIHSLVYFFAMQVLTGIFQASGWPCVVAAVGNWFGEGRRGLIMGIWNSHVSVGNIAGSAIAGIWSGNEWGWSFIAPGMIIFFLGLIMILFLVTHPSYVGLTPERSRLKDSIFVRMNEDMPEKVMQAHGRIQSMTSMASSLQKGKEGKAISFFGALLIPGVIEYSLCLFFAKLVSYTFLYWLPFYIKNTVIGGRRFDSEDAADLAIYFDVGGIVGGIMAGFISDKTKCSGITCFVMLIIAAPMLFLYKFHGNHSLVINVVLMIISGIFVNGPYALITTAVSASLGSHQSLKGNTKAMATVTSIIDGTGSFGAATGPLLAGFFQGWDFVFYLLIGADIVAAMLLGRQVYHEIKLWVVLCQEKVDCANSRKTSERDPLIASSRKASGDESDGSRISGSPEF